MSAKSRQDEVGRKEAFDWDKACYEQKFQRYRAMNQIMWQVPLLAISITGGLWLAALNVAGAHEFQQPLFLLALVLDIALIAVLPRVRCVMSAYMEKMKFFNPPAFVEAAGRGPFSRSYTVVGAFSLALAVAAIGSLIGLLNLDWLRMQS